MKFMNRKLLILLSAIVLMVVAGGALVVVRKYQTNRKVQQWRVEGFKAFDVGDDQLAVKHLHNYLVSYGDDTEALYRYALVRERVPLKKFRHANRAMGALRRVLELDPEHPSARRELLKLYRRYGLATEAVKLTAELLRARPDDADVLLTRTWALMVIMRHDEALKTVRLVLKQQPRDFESRLLELDLMRRTGLVDGQIAAKVRQNRELNADDLRFVLFEAVAARMAGDRDAAMEYLISIADADPSDDAELMGALAREFDAWGQYKRSMKLLSDLAPSATNPAIRRLYAERLWQTQRVGALLEFLDDVSADDPQADSRLLVLKALGLVVRDGKVPVGIAEALARRHGDPVTEAWASVLKHGLADTKLEPKAVLRLYERAVGRAPNEPNLRFLLAQTLRAQGHLRAAIQHLLVAARSGSAWAQPLIEIARIYSELRQPQNAVYAAIEALLRSPSNIEAAIVLANAAARGEMKIISQTDLLNLVAEIQRVAPGEPRTLPLYVSLLARTGDRDKAVAVVRSMLEAENKPAVETLLSLANVCRKEDLGLAAAALDRCEQAHGLSPALAITRAIHAWAKEKDAAAGLRALERDGARVELERDDVLWRRARARFLEMIDDPDAADTWVALADANPERLPIQREAIQAASVRRRQDLRDFLDRAIDRVREQDEADGEFWRVARARWLLDRKDSVETAAQAALLRKDRAERAAEAAMLLNEVLNISPENTEAHVRLAECLVRLDDSAGAIEHLQKAAEAAPQSVDIALALVQLLQSNRKFSAAERHIDRALEQSLTQKQRRRAAALVARQGDSDRAVYILRGALDDDSDQQEPDLLLAAMYRQRNEVEKTRDVIEQLLSPDSAETKPSALLIRFAADFFAEQGDLERAGQVLARLADLDLVPGVSELILAQHHVRRGSGSLDLAAEYYVAATAAAAKNPQELEQRFVLEQAWPQRFILELQRGRTKRCVEVAERAIAHLPDHKGFRAILDHRQIILPLEKRIELRPLAVAMLGSRQYRDAAAEALTLLVGAGPVKAGRTKTKQDEERITRLLARLRPLAEHNPYFLPLQTLAATIFDEAGQGDEAIRLVTRAMAAFPDEGRPARMGAGFLQAARRWEEAFGAAQQWRHRDPRQAKTADVFLAQCNIQLGRPQQALQTLAPYLEQAIANPGAHYGVLSRYTKALLDLGDTARAAELLRPMGPMLRDSPQLREVWREFIVRKIRDRAEAEQWTSTLAVATPDDALRERLALSRVWGQLGRRFDAQELSGRSLDVLISLTDHPQATAGMHLIRGALAETGGDLAQAERSYRRILEIDTKHSLARNNLAMVLTKLGKAPDEALDLARAVVKAQPGTAAFHDTLAEVHLGANRYDRALKAIDRALELRPNNVELALNRTWILAAAGRLAEAEPAFRAIESRLPPLDRLPEAARRRVQALRDRFAARSPGTADPGA